MRGLPIKEQEILAGKRPFSRQIIRTLAAYFHGDVSVLAGNI